MYADFSFRADYREFYGLQDISMFIYTQDTGISVTRANGCIKYWNT
jgi:hypothetical protein